MTKIFEKLCKNCGRRYEQRQEKCPHCGDTRWEILGFRAYCKEDGCSLTLNHKGDHLPWPTFRTIEKGSSEDYAPQVEGETMQIDPKDGQLGVYRKYLMIERTDGRHVEGEKHHGCAYFILDLTHDPHAVPALRAYAESCRRTHPQLCRDLWKTVGRGDEDPDVDLALWSPLPTLEDADDG